MRDYGRVGERVGEREVSRKGARDHSTAGGRRPFAFKGPFAEFTRPRLEL